MELRRITVHLRRIPRRVKCLLGRHWVADIFEHDASVKRGWCMNCMKDLPPRRPRPADPEFAAELSSLRLEAERLMDEEY